MPVYLSDEEYQQLMKQGGSFLPGNDLPQGGGFTGDITSSGGPPVASTIPDGTISKQQSSQGGAPEVGGAIEGISGFNKKYPGGASQGTSAGGDYYTEPSAGEKYGSLLGPEGGEIGAFIDKPKKKKTSAAKVNEARAEQIKEETRQNKMQRKALNPLGEQYDEQMNMLSYFGPVSRVLPMSDKAMKALGMKPLNKGQKIINFLRPPTPEYNFSQANKAMGVAQNMQAANKILTNLSLYGSMLNSLSGLSAGELETLG